MFGIRYAALAGCFLLCACNGRAIDTLHSTPLIQFNYPSPVQVDPLQTGSTASPALRPPSNAAANDQPLESAIAVDRRQSAPIPSLMPQAVNISMTEASLAGSATDNLQSYGLSAAGKLTLPPPRKLEIIDVGQISRALEVQGTDADVLKLEADEAVSSAE